jgi:hypothetical protein
MKLSTDHILKDIQEETVEAQARHAAMQVDDITQDPDAKQAPVVSAARFVYEIAYTLDPSSIYLLENVSSPTSGLKVRHWCSQKAPPSLESSPSMYHSRHRNCHLM